MNESETAIYDTLKRSYRRHLEAISDLNELIEVVAGEWWNLKLTCGCDPTKKEACSVCEIGFRLKEWQEDRYAEGPQE